MTGYKQEKKHMLKIPSIILAVGVGIASAGEVVSAIAFTREGFVMRVHRDGTTTLLNQWARPSGGIDWVGADAKPGGGIYALAFDGTIATSDDLTSPPTIVGSLQQPTPFSFFWRISSASDGRLLTIRSSFVSDPDTVVSFDPLDLSDVVEVVSSTEKLWQLQELDPGISFAVQTRNDELDIYRLSTSNPSPVTLLELNDELGITDGFDIYGQWLGVLTSANYVRVYDIVTGERTQQFELPDYDAVQPSRNSDAPVGFFIEEFQEPSACLSDIAMPLGQLNIDDVLAFLTAFRDNVAAADLDRNGTFDIDDVLILLREFGEGCTGEP